MYKVTVIGHFGNGQHCNDGQTIKTQIITKELKRIIGAETINTVDTHGRFKALLFAPFNVKRAFQNSKNVVLLPSQNGLRVFAPLFAFAKKRFNKVKTHYIVLGGWLTTYMNMHKNLVDPLEAFDYIYAETSNMKNELEKRGFNNVVLMPNCKDLHILHEEELVYNSSEPLKLCTFSRVMKEKGIEDAVETVKEVNRYYGRTVYQLDIFGQIDKNQTEWFCKYRKSFPKYVQYKGIIPFDYSVDVIKDYFLLLFPTHYYTEGIPGTIIDALSAGVPAVCAKWENFSDIIDDGINGCGYGFQNTDELKTLLIHFADCPQSAVEMKKNCLKKANCYLPENALSVLSERLL